MKKIYQNIFLLIGIQLIGMTFCPLWVNAQSGQDKSDWILIWQDEFEDDHIDTTKWRIEDAALIKNNEKQYYTPDDVYLEDGHLILRSQKREMGGRDYTSGLVETKGLFTQTYGFFEIRAKLPKGKGIWPAHWMMNAVGTWPPEIDIMEMLGHQPNKIHMTNHFGLHPNNSHQGGFYVGPDYSKEFHTFAVEWNPRELRWYIDGVERYSTKRHIPDVPFYLILNTAVGGNWPGNPNKTTEFPQYHFIDYVRVYKKDISGTAFIDVTADNGKVEIQPDQHRYKIGTEVKVFTEPSIGYTFDRWEGDIQGHSNPLTISMEKNLRIVAKFKIDPNAPQLISRGKKVSASSIESQDLIADNVVDGDLNTRWSSEFTDEQWIMIDLEKVRPIKAIQLNWESAYGKEYEIQISDNRSNWKTVKSIVDYVGQEQQMWLENVTGRYVRLKGIKRATEWGYSLWEFRIYGE